MKEKQKSVTSLCDIRIIYICFLCYVGKQKKSYILLLILKSAYNILLPSCLQIPKKCVEYFKNAIMTSFSVTEDSSFYIILCVMHFSAKLGQGKA